MPHNMLHSDSFDPLRWEAESLARGRLTTDKVYLRRKDDVRYTVITNLPPQEQADDMRIEGLVWTMLETDAVVMQRREALATEILQELRRMRA